MGVGGGWMSSQPLRLCFSKCDLGTNRIEMQWQPHPRIQKLQSLHDPKQFTDMLKFKKRGYHRFYWQVYWLDSLPGNGQDRPLKLLAPFERPRLWEPDREEVKLQEVKVHAWAWPWACYFWMAPSSYSLWTELILVNRWVRRSWPRASFCIEEGTKGIWTATWDQRYIPSSPLQWEWYPKSWRDPSAPVNRQVTRWGTNLQTSLLPLTVELGEIQNSDVRIVLLLDIHD